MSFEALIDKFRSVGLERVTRLNLALIELESGNPDPEHSQEAIREIHTLKGEAKMLGFADINLVAHLTESILLSNDESLNWELAYEGLDIIRVLLTKNVGSGPPVDLSGFVERFTGAFHGAQITPKRESNAQPVERRVTVTTPKTTSNQIRVNLKELENLGDSASDALMLSRRFLFQLEALERGFVRSADLNEAIAYLPKSMQDRLDRTIRYLERHTSELRQSAMALAEDTMKLEGDARRLRHVPIAQFFGHYPRAVRDLAAASDKRVRFETDYGDADVDRVILAGLSEPLLHLMRNAVDHGIESPEDRRDRGKPEDGLIRLTTDYQSEQIVVTLSDDGAGIDVDRVTDRAVERGLISEQERNSLTVAQRMGLVFESGFSTREYVTDISGRGIGMDIVRRAVMKLGGTIDLQSEVGVGTSFAITVPVSSSVRSIVTFELSSHQFAVPSQHILRVEEVAKTDLVRSEGKWRTDAGTLVVDWRPLLGLAPATMPDSVTLMKLRYGNKDVALWIDAVLSDRPTIVRPMGAFLNTSTACEGIAVTEANDLVPILDIQHLLEMRSLAVVPYRQLTEYSEIQMPRFTILLVEDSEVTRSLVKRILTSNGHTVVEAEDGKAGLAMLREHDVDLAISDIQMPRMSGLEFLTEVRKSAVTKSLPVIMLTTLGSEHEREQGRKTGANAYLVKLDFREQELLDVIDDVMSSI